MTKVDSPGFEFVAVVTCVNPMEIEIYPATLREREIPHRTEWDASGNLRVMVPRQWFLESRAAVEAAARVFFGEKITLVGCEQGTARSPIQNEVEVKGKNGAGENDDEDEDEDEQERSALFVSRRLLFAKDHRAPDTDGFKVRPVWPAWALAAFPGLGLGHLYAGKVHVFFHLVLLTAVAVAFFLYSGSWYPVVFVCVSWGTDLGFAAYHVKQHNQRARKHQEQLAEEQKRFLDSI